VIETRGFVYKIEANMPTKNVAWFVFPIIAMLSVACSGKAGGGNGNGPDSSVNPPGQNDGGGTNPVNDGGGTNPVNDGGGTNPVNDGGAVVPPGCGITQCSNCVDDDSDGDIDGTDVHCISAADDDESSFATGIPGDNRDAKPDCFFDGNSGSGNDGCEIELCCLLTDDDCGGTTDCSISQMCIDFCAPASPVGCDCFGCCTICQDGNCKDILTIPDSTPGWDCDNLDNLNDPVKCPQCFKVTECESSCDTGDGDCILCPGQNPDELPAECDMQNECPDGRQVCDAATACPILQYCANNCCIDIVIE
jgi:hypothetical protein